MSQETLLKVSGLKVAYGGIQAVKGASFEVHQGELVSLIGANGAGKTTTLKAITGIQPIAAGEVEVYGGDLGPGTTELCMAGEALGRRLIGRGHRVEEHRAHLAAWLASGEGFDREREALVALRRRAADEHVDVGEAVAARLLRISPRQLGYALQKNRIEVRKF